LCRKYVSRFVSRTCKSCLAVVGQSECSVLIELKDVFDPTVDGNVVVRNYFVFPWPKICQNLLQQRHTKPSSVKNRKYLVLFNIDQYQICNVFVPE
jgi:hypothetical protein